VPPGTTHVQVTRRADLLPGLAAFLHRPDPDLPIAARAVG
jgi:hypothetical protein